MIGIIDYDAGNLTSVARAVRHLGYACVVTREREALTQCERIIFPGVGAAGAAMRSLQQLRLDDFLRQTVAQGTPVLGICLGSQIILSHSDENDTPCLDLLPGRVRLFPGGLTENGRRLKIPHMGWNHIHVLQPHPVLAGIQPADAFYFVHSYYPDPASPSAVLAATTYGLSFASVTAGGSLVACQFHPEKSGPPGLRLLRNFCGWHPGENPPC